MQRPCWTLVMARMMGRFSLADWTGRLISGFPRTRTQGAEERNADGTDRLDVERGEVKTLGTHKAGVKAVTYNGETSTETALGNW